MHHQACRLVDDHQLVVLIAHVERHLLWHDGGVEVRTSEAKADDVACTNLIIALDGFVVDKEESALGSLLYAVAAGVLSMLSKVFVDAQRYLTTVYLDAQMLI